jgi:hypothetical protein
MSGVDKGKAGGDNGGVGEVDVVADDEEGSRRGYVFLTPGLPVPEGNRQNAYEAATEIIDPVHLVVLSPAGKR